METEGWLGPEGCLDGRGYTAAANTEENLLQTIWKRAGTAHVCRHTWLFLQLLGMELRSPVWSGECLSAHSSSTGSCTACPSSSRKRAEQKMTWQQGPHQEDCGSKQPSPFACCSPARGKCQRLVIKCHTCIHPVCCTGICKQ